jgi:hypothetical protein
MREVLPEIERRMQGDFPNRLLDWRAGSESAIAKQEQWKAEVRTAQKAGNPAPLPPSDAPPEPQAPRLRQNDVTVEKVASLLSNAAPKGLLIVRDELAGFLLGLSAYNDSGRAFWLEAYGGRPYRVERQKNPEPIIVERLGVSVTGGTQPERLAEMFEGPDDGLLGRITWVWPEPMPFQLSREAPHVHFAIEALDRLRRLELSLATLEMPASPIYVPLENGARDIIETFAQSMQTAQQNASGLLRSAFGKARGLALRLSLNIEYLKWAGLPGCEAPPNYISIGSITAACSLVRDYFIPMAARVYGDAAIPMSERNILILARWITENRPREVHVRTLLREVRLPGLSSAELIKSAAAALVEAGWLRAPERGTQEGRAKVAYPVNPAISEILH